MLSVRVDTCTQTVMTEKQDLRPHTLQVRCHADHHYSFLGVG